MLMRVTRRTGKRLALTDPPRHRSPRTEKVVAHLPEHDPVLAALAIWCDIVDGAEAQTFTRNDTIHIGQTFEALPLREQIGVLGHHVMHVALRHEHRMQVLQSRYGQGFDPDLHNLCSDAILNECLTRGGLALPRPVVQLSDLLAHSPLPGLDPTQDILQHWDVDRLYLAVKRSGADMTALKEGCGFSPDIRPDDAPLKADRVAGVWRAHLIRAAQSAGSMGRGIGPLLRHLADIRQSQTPWEHRLRRLLLKALSPNPRRSYRRPRSAWIAAEALAVSSGGPVPVFEPALKPEAFRPRLVIAVDASGSVETETLALFAGEVIGITNKTGAETHLLCFDEEVFAHKTLTALNARSTFYDLPFRRDGGTSFIDVLSKADALNPSMILVMTDLLGAYGAQPKAPVLWASPVAVTTAPPFGEVIELVR